MDKGDIIKGGLTTTAVGLGGYTAGATTTGIGDGNFWKGFLTLSKFCSRRNFRRL